LDVPIFFIFYVAPTGCYIAVLFFVTWIGTLFRYIIALFLIALATPSCQDESIYPVGSSVTSCPAHGACWQLFWGMFSHEDIHWFALKMQLFHIIFRLLETASK
jgi:hypothetical protein